jgi:hypothetical protein
MSIMLDECAVRAMRWPLWQQEMQTRPWWGLAESGDRFCVGALVRNLTSLAVKMFSEIL